jgi:hypothetical protein
MGAMSACCAGYCDSFTQLGNLSLPSAIVSGQTTKLTVRLDLHMPDR